MKQYQRITELTEDGSVTLYIPEIDEHYHSTHGAIVEAMHVYIQTGLAFRAQSVDQLTVLEVGFGTGLNAFLSAIFAHTSGKSIHYTSLELYPLGAEITTGLNYVQQYITAHPEVLTLMSEQELKGLFQALHAVPWEEEVEIIPGFVLYKKQSDLLTVKLDRLYDVVYFDAFAPEKQPEMWSEANFEKIAIHVKEEGVLTTYCAKGVIRRRIQSFGFIMQRLPGPPGKREILRGIKA